MLGALRVNTVQRGLDPREFGIVAFGGAGPLHGNALAAVIGCYPVIVPTNPGVLSAMGFLQSQFKNEFVQTLIRSTVGLDAAEVWTHFDRLRDQALAWLVHEEVAAADQVVRYSADLRYEQQGFEVTIDIDREEIDGDRLAEIVDRFHEVHENTYGVRFDVPVELVALRVVAVGLTPEVEEKISGDGVTSLELALIETKPAYFDGRWIETPHYDRDRLPIGATFDGPAIVRQYDATTVVLPAHRVEVDEFGNLIIRPSTAAEA